MYNKAGHAESRRRDEGAHAKHIKSDGSVPIMGAKGRSIHGAHTGEMSKAATGGMATDSGSDHMHKGKPGDHEENA